MQKSLILFLFSVFLCLTVTAQTESGLSKKNEKLLNKVFSSYRSKKFQKALSFMDDAMQSEEIQQFSAASLLQANIYFALKNYDDAKSTYLRTIQIARPSENLTEFAQIGLVRSMAKLSKIKDSENKKKEKASQTPMTTTEPNEEKVAFTIIEQVPIYPGCENKSTNAAYKACMQQQIVTHVSNNFNTGISRAVGINGRIEISVQFKISKTGDIVDVDANALNPLLEEEAIRVIERLPQMQPGKQKGKPVGVIYGLPIIFNLK